MGFDSCSPTLVVKRLGVRFERKSHTPLNNKAKKLVHGAKSLNDKKYSVGIANS
jgi:hypothetical protein